MKPRRRAVVSLPRIRLYRGNLSTVARADTARTFHRSWKQWVKSEGETGPSAGYTVYRVPNTVSRIPCTEYRVPCTFRMMWQKSVVQIIIWKKNVWFLYCGWWMFTTLDDMAIETMAWRCDHSTWFDNWPLFLKESSERFVGANASSASTIFWGL